MARGSNNIRAAAALAVDEVLSNGRSLDAVIDAASIEGRDQSLYRMLCYGTLRSHFRLAAWLAHLLDKPIRKRDSVVTALLQVGLFQLSESRIPDHAAVSETVAAVRALGYPRYAGLVNAILRRAGRETFEPDSEEARLNHPQWIIDRTKADWPDDWVSILEANDQRAPMWLRVNTRRNTRNDYAATLDEAGLAASTNPALPQALLLDEPLAVSGLPGFADGDVSVQDGGAQLAAPWIAEGAGGRFLDACAAPGGKAAHWLELSGPDDALTCLEIDAKRAGVISETLSRLGLDATVITADASNTDNWWDGELFDAILLDAPCSASGVIRRHPDIKLLRRDSDIDSLSALQTTLLEQLWRVLKPGGRLLYVTCSVFRQENEGVVGPFVADHDDAREIDVLHNNNIRALMRRKAPGYQLLPGTEGMDGFYFACLAKAT